MYASSPLSFAGIHLRLLHIGTEGCRVLPVTPKLSHVMGLDFTSPQSLNIDVYQHLVKGSGYQATQHRALIGQCVCVCVKEKGAGAT